MKVETDWLEGRARITPHRAAIKDSETNQWWTYQQLNIRALNLAKYLLEHGVQRGDRVVLIVPNHISYFDFLFACIKIGSIFVPINWRLSKHEMKSIIDDCSPSFIGVMKEKEDMTNDTGISYICVDRELYETIVNKRNSLQIVGQIHEKDPIAILYTSGSTGIPKGVIISYKAMLSNAYNTIVSWSLKETDITLTCTPMFHTAGLFALTIPILMMGGKVIILPKFKPDKVMYLIEQEKCTVVFMVPTMYHIMIHSPLFKKSKFSSINVFISGGAPCPKSIYQAFKAKGLYFKEAYGMTEAGPNNFFIDPIEAQKKVGSVGKPIIFNDVQVYNEHGKLAQSNEIGEVVISGHHLFEGYWNKKEETEKVLRDGKFYTGDLAKVDEDGYFYIVGRKKDLIISGGENIYPLEIEHVLHDHPAVCENAVLGLPDEKWGEIVVAFISLKPFHSLQAEELRQYCRQHLAHYKIPKKIFLLDRLPKNPAGKIDKKRLTALCNDIEPMHVAIK